jgi:phage shock protein PspC (stress-responsive transcriptional regulator)
MTNALPPQDHTPTPTRPPLRRSGTDRMLGGVCGGLAEYSGIDAVLWRVGVVGLTIAGGAGVVVYLLLWVLLPSAPLPADRSPSIVDGFVDRLHVAVTNTRSGPAPTDRP